MMVQGRILLLVVQMTILNAWCDVFQNALTPSDALVQIKEKAEAGDAVAETKLGDYYKGSFMHAAAKHWYEAAAIQGYPPGLAALGDMYATSGGFGTNRIVGNLTNAFALHRLAAAQGYQRSHYAVGMAYREGRVVPRNLVFAYKHLKLSRQMIIADTYLKQVILEMSHEQINEAEKETSAFKVVSFREAFEDLVFDSIKLGGVFGSGGNRMALINGMPIAAGERINLTVAALPVSIKCKSIDKGGVVLSFGSTRRLLGPTAKPAG